MIAQVAGVQARMIAAAFPGRGKFGRGNIKSAVRFPSRILQPKKLRLHDFALVFDIVERRTVLTQGA